MNQDFGQFSLNQKLSINKWILVAIIVVILAMTTGAAAYFWSESIIRKNKQEQLEQKIKSLENLLPVSYSEDCSWRLSPKEDRGLCSEDSGAYFDGDECVSTKRCGTNSNISGAPFESLSSCQQKCESLVPSHYEVEVEWNSELVLQSALINEGSEGLEDYLAGKIINGSLSGMSGKNLYLEIEHGQGKNFRHYVFMGEGMKFYLDGYYGDEKAKNWEIKGITDLPEEVYFSDTNYKIKKYGNVNYLFSKVSAKAKKIFNHKLLSDFYLTEEGCLVAELPNHTAVAYDFELPFISYENKELEIILDNGAEYGGEYGFTNILGCGGLCSPLKKADVLSDDLIIMGRTKTGETFYQLKNPKAVSLIDLYDDKNTLAYFNTDGKFEKLEKSKYSYLDFLNLYPLLYWQDPLGRWIEFKNKKLEVLAEMCKPAIYLYPEQERDLNVKVVPNGGFTKTAPLYGVDGWNVKANVDGVIIDLNTKNQHDYLYWSGIAINYPVNNEEGWVVKKESLELFLDEKLAILGLNKREISDFKEYWLSQLDKMPYYQISFLPQSQFDEIAPLTLSLNPDSVIRVMMTAQGLSEDKEIKEQQLPVTPKRDGFSVVEWGGTLLR